MKKWVSRQHGQALVELAAVLFLFGLFIIGVLQLAQLGMGQVRAQEAARRAAWLRNRLNNAPLQDAQFESMGAKLIASEGGRDDMTSVVVEVQVPAYGFFSGDQAERVPGESSGRGDQLYSQTDHRRRDQG